MDIIGPVELLRRQYLQLLTPDKLTISSKKILCPKTQLNIYESIFKESNIKYAPPERYRFRVLKRIVYALEKAIEDPEEDVGFFIGHCSIDRMTVSISSLIFSVTISW